MSLAEKSRSDEDYIRFQLEQLEEACLVAVSYTHLDVYKRQLLYCK